MSFSAEAPAEISPGIRPNLERAQDGSKGRLNIGRSTQTLLKLGIDGLADNQSFASRDLPGD
jgi:hypothetical protein